MSQKNRDYFADLVDCIVSQQLSVKAAATIYARLEKLCGKIIPQKILDLDIDSISRPDVFPADDLGIQNAMIKKYGLKKDKQLRTKMLKIAETWRPHRTRECKKLWKSLDNE